MSKICSEVLNSVGLFSKCIQKAYKHLIFITKSTTIGLFYAKFAKYSKKNNSLTYSYSWAYYYS